MAGSAAVMAIWLGLLGALDVLETRLCWNQKLSGALTAAIVLFVTFPGKDESHLSSCAAGRPVKKRMENS